MGGLTWPCHNRVLPPVGLRWSRRVEQFGGLVKLGSGCGHAASFVIPVALYASSGVHPASVEFPRLPVDWDTL
jgi:hypothetical protein